MFLGNKRMRTVTNFFIFNLALTDLINTIFNSIFNFIFMKNKYTVHLIMYLLIFTNVIKEIGSSEPTSVA